MTPPATIALGALPVEAREALRVAAAVLDPGHEAWLVGGAVRDLLLGVPVRELDLVVPRGAVALGRALADRHGAGFVVLDEGRGVCRVVGEPSIDIADFRAPTLAEDLRARDFTVNALAVPLAALLATPPPRAPGAVVEAVPVVDATGGLADLAARRVRLCAPAALRDDPLRVLRGVRLSLRPGWRLDAEVEREARATAAAVTGVSAERLRAELVAMLAEPTAGQGLRRLDALDVLGRLFPETAAMRATPQPDPHRFDVLEHSLRAVEGADALAADLGPLAPWTGALAEHLVEDLGDGVTRREALKLAALLHDVSKPETRAVVDGRVRFLGHDRLGAERAVDVARRFRLSSRATAAISRLVRQHLRPMHLAQAGGITRRARYRFFRDLGADARDLLLLGLADAGAVRGDGPHAVWRGPGGAIVRDLMAGADSEEREAAAPALLRGDDVMVALGLPPGPDVGRVLAEAREAQAVGLFGDREAALRWLRREGRALLDSGGGHF